MLVRGLYAAYQSLILPGDVCNQARVPTSPRAIEVTAAPAHSSATPTMRSIVTCSPSTAAPQRSPLGLGPDAEPWASAGFAALNPRYALTETWVRAPA
jgi:hypothetical protein